ncbi:polysaccharide pyruvyl transferase family protein [Georgenia sp. MJ173]|uniref:polysaccharide pyruvyl transferase family protein n=1 Tax=Georgenia sunbinii TaxID=3117728 RepID=UPI002F25F130
MLTMFGQILDDLKIRRTTLQMAEVVVVPPNGALLDTYEFPWILRDALRQAPNLPVVIFPSSAYFPEVDPSFMFEGRPAATTWIMREGNSFRHLQSAWGESLTRVGVRLELDHDVVASAGKFLPTQFPSSGSTGYLLVAARLDRESSSSALSRGSGAEKLPSLKSRLKRGWLKLPNSRVKTFIGRYAKRAELQKSGKLLESRLSKVAWQDLGITPDVVATLPRRYVDISSPQFATYREYGKLIEGATAVISDRLHVAMPAALLGKPTVMVEAGYYKLGGVYQRSLTDLPNVYYVR